jgi:Acetokinase family
MIAAATEPLVGVINAGSSSVKFSFYEGERRVLGGQVEGIGARPSASATGPDGERITPPNLGAKPPSVPSEVLPAILPWQEPDSATGDLRRSATAWFTAGCATPGPPASLRNCCPSSRLWCRSHHCMSPTTSRRSAAALGGLDGVVFTAGVGENAAPVRSAVCQACAWLGLELDEAANRERRDRISTLKSRVAAYVIRTDENLMIARHARALVGG